MIDEHDNPWQKINSKKIYDNPWIILEEDQVINPRGGKGIYGKVLMKNKAIGIIPIDENGNTWLVGQYRYTLDAYSWEIPMGGGPVALDILESAKRELKEETGLLAQRWEMLLRIHTSNSVTDEEGFVFTAQGLEQQATEFDETEDLQIKKLPLTKAIRWVMKGKITDSLSMAGLLKLALVKGIKV
jgi:8-oxo-dGTP pyrophosphatase MutT (NUDIX family)